MLVKRYINKKSYAVEMGKPLYKQGFSTDSGIIEFALINTNKSRKIYDIKEIKSRMSEHEKIEDLPLWKEEDNESGI